MFDPEVCERFRALGFWRDRTYLEDFDDRVRCHPDSDAIISRRGGTQLQRIRYRELAQMAGRFAAALVSLGVKRGEVVSLQLPNCWEFTALVIACGRIGAVVCPLVPLYRRRELCAMLERTRSRVCIGPGVLRGFDHAAMFDELKAALPDLQHVFSLDDTFRTYFVDTAWEERIDVSSLAIEPDELALVQFTSGTSGEPKGVQHTPNTLWSASRVPRDLYGASSADVVLMASTLAHQTGFLYGVLAPLSEGMKIVYQEIWDPIAFLELVDEAGVTWSMGATPFIVDTVRAQRDVRASLATLDWYICGGAPIPPQLVSASREVLGVDLISCWGMTENGITTTTRPRDDNERAASTDGAVVPWMEIAVVDEGGRALPDGETGRLLVRGASQTPGYFGREELYASQCVHRLEGDSPFAGIPWFDSGDLARCTQTSIRIDGRAKDLVIRGGENIPVVEIEALLLTHPRVRECAIVGYPDDRLGERACAVVVPDGAAPDLADLVKYLAGQGTAKQYWPERLELVEEMPRTPSGKIQKVRLRERFACGPI